MGFPAPYQGDFEIKRLGSNEEWVYNPWIRSYFEIVIGSLTVFALGYWL